MLENYENLNKAEFDFFMMLLQKKAEMEAQYNELNNQINSYIVDSIESKGGETIIGDTYEIDIANKKIVCLSKKELKR